MATLGEFSTIFGCDAFNYTAGGPMLNIVVLIYISFDFSLKFNNFKILQCSFLIYFVYYKNIWEGPFNCGLAMQFRLLMLVMFCMLMCFLLDAALLKLYICTVYLCDSGCQVKHLLVNALNHQDIPQR